MRVPKTPWRLLCPSPRRTWRITKARFVILHVLRGEGHRRRQGVLGTLPSGVPKHLHGEPHLLQPPSLGGLSCLTGIPHDGLLRGGSFSPHKPNASGGSSWRKIQPRAGAFEVTESHISFNPTAETSEQYVALLLTKMQHLLTKMQQDALMWEWRSLPAAQHRTNPCHAGPRRLRQTLGSGPNTA